MPLHDWTRVPAGLFHHFHQDWTIEIARTLNRGLLPHGAAALVEQRSAEREADVLTVKALAPPPRYDLEVNGGVAVATPPATRIVRRTANEHYADRANRIVIRHHLGRIIAVIEVVSPGNKDRRPALEEFVKKTAEYLNRGIHVLVVDLFPPTRRDPFGIHKAIWDELVDEPFEFPTGKDRILVSYHAGYELTAYIEPVAVGDMLPDMPLFLTRNRPQNLHVQVPLERTYQATWDATPQVLRVAVETGELPDADAAD
jgi:hypothetical protein